MSSELLQKVDAILDQTEIPERHTFFQIKNFIIGKEYTVQGQLWQVVRELKARKESLDALELQIADAEDNVELIDIDIEDLNSELEIHSDGKALLRIRRREIRTRKLEREKAALLKNVQSLKNKVKYLLEEVTYLVGAFETLSRVEQIKAIDDVGAQKQYWNEKLATHLNLKLLLKNPLDADFVNTILALDDDAPVKQHMLGMLDRVQKLMIEERDRQRAALATAKALSGIGEK
jgi:hypothetical protein